MDESLHDLILKIQQRFGAELQEIRQDISLTVTPRKNVELLQTLKNEAGFEMMGDLAAVDYYPQEEPRFVVVYQLVSISNHAHLQVRVPLSGSSPHITSVEKVYPGANWYEREIWDMFGIAVDEHSDLRRILMPFDWEGHPLRKDYPLGYEEVQFNFNFSEIAINKPHGVE
jgi:NADH-quinone oxidoreductase subunit C